LSAIDDKIEENAQRPKRFSGDSETVEQHDLSEQIKASKHLAGNQAATKGHRGIRFTKLIPPGAS
jgi:hypothetical protein